MSLKLPPINSASGQFPDAVRERLAENLADPTTFEGAVIAGREAGTAKVVYVSPNGDDSNPGLTMSGAKLTLAGAHAVMGTSPGMIILDNGVITVTGTFKWPATAKCGMIGQGIGNTTIQATAQTGPVIDLSGVGYNLRGTQFGKFMIEGDGTAGSAKKGLVFDPVTSYTQGWVHHIRVRNTGGAGFDLGYAEVTDFDCLIVDTPVGAAANDIPYLMATGAFNGNRITGLQLHGDTGAAVNVGVSGAVVIKDNGSTAPHDNYISAPLIEALHLPTGATIFALQGNSQVLSDLQMFDTNKMSGATGTSHVRYTDPTGTSLKAGGNLFRGIIPGKSTAATDIDMGVDMQQSRNAVVGVKGYKGTNVVIAAGVNQTLVDLGGAVSSASDPAVVDNSGTLTNVVVDAYLQTTRAGTMTFQQGATSYTHDNPGGAWAGGPRFSDPGTPASGSVGVGTGGVRMQASALNMLLTANQILLRTIALTPAPLVLGSNLNTDVSIRTGTGTPEGVVTAKIGSIFLRSDGGAGTTLYLKETGTGNTGWRAV